VKNIFNEEVSQEIGLINAEKIQNI